eukprot:augustus_masked-scaffold_22-processed-gene-0.13-mRNA-1 protein AED:1.00 eAED:1.00 QI:0/0/0/0/1/1/2/0/232
MFVVFPLTFSKLSLGEFKNERKLSDINSILRIVEKNFEVTVQDCDILEYEELIECSVPFNTALTAVLNTLSDEDLTQVGEILSNPELTPEEIGEQLEEALGEGVLCTAEVEDGLVEAVSCANLCGDEICEDVREELRESVQNAGFIVGCDFSVAQVCGEDSSADYFDGRLFVEVLPAQPSIEEWDVRIDEVAKPTDNSLMSKIFHKIGNKSSKRYNGKNGKGGMGVAGRDAQ